MIDECGEAKIQAKNEKALLLLRLLLGVQETLFKKWLQKFNALSNYIYKMVSVKRARKIEFSSNFQDVLTNHIKKFENSEFVVAIKARRVEEAGYLFELLDARSDF